MLIAGGINLSGPILLKGEALSEKMGSVIIVTPFLFIRKVEWPIQIIKLSCLHQLTCVL